MCLPLTNWLSVVCLATSLYCGGLPDTDLRSTQPVSLGFRDPSRVGWRELYFVSTLLLLRAMEIAEGEAERGAGQERLRRYLHIIIVLLILFDTLLQV